MKTRTAAATICVTVTPSIRTPLQPPPISKREKIILVQQDQAKMNWRW
jgi:hypothetical protein